MLYDFSILSSVFLIGLGLWSSPASNVEILSEDFRLQAISPTPIHAFVYEQATYSDTVFSTGVEQLQNGRYQEAIDTLQLIFESQQTGSDISIRIQALILIAEAQYRLSSYEESLSGYEMALENIRSQSDPQLSSADSLLESLILSQIGQNYYRLSDYPTALEYYNQALVIQQTGDIQSLEAEKAETFQALTLHYIAEVWRRQGKLSDALEQAEKALDISHELDRPILHSMILDNLGAIYSALGQYDEGLKYAELALSMIQAARDPYIEARILHSIGVNHLNHGRYAESLRYLQQSLGLQQDIEDRAGEARTIGSIGSVFASQGDYEQAIEQYEKALPIHQSVGDRVSEGETLQKLASVYLSLGDYDQALDLLETTSQIQLDIGNRPGLGNTFLIKGNVHQNKGQYSIAKESIDNAINIFRDIGDLAGESTALNALASIHYSLGEFDQALRLYEMAAEVQSTVGDQAGMAASLNNIGLTYSRTGNTEEALNHLQEALAIRRRIGVLGGVASTLSNIGLVYQQQSENDQALDAMQRSLGIRQEIGDRSGEATVLNNIALIYEEQGQYATALEMYQLALAIFRDIGNRAGEQLTLSNIGYLLETQGDVELAIIFYKESVTVAEQIRSDLKSFSLEQQQSYTDEVADTYRRLADLLLQQDRILEAQRVLDLLKVQELDTFLRGVRSNRNTESGTGLVPPETIIASAHDDLIERAIKNGKRLNELEAKPDLTDTELDELVALQAERLEILQAFNDFRDSPIVQEQLALLSPQERERNVQLGELAALQDNLGQIPQGAVLLYPLILDNTLELVVVSPYAPPIHRTANVTPQQLNEAVQAFRYALEEPTRDAVPPAQTLYQWLIAPIEADLEAAGINTIIYAPDRVLRYIPLAALHDGEQWVTERYRVNNITAASLTDLTTQPVNQPAILAGALTEGPITINVGDNNYRFDLLEHADDEVQAIRTVAPDTTPLLNTDFNRTLIERESNRHTILHLATHAKFVVGQPEESFILFSDEERWTLADFREGLLTLTRVDLVVLSACETAVDNTFGNGEEILGFGYLMETAGARAAMASLWAVDDGGTQILMHEFYDGLVRGNLSKVEALRQAQLSLIRLAESGDRGGFELAQSVGLDPNNLSHPYYWAPFILIGNGL